jgi:hypothetical protein
MYQVLTHLGDAERFATLVNTWILRYTSEGVEGVEGADPRAYVVNDMRLNPDIVCVVNFDGTTFEVQPGDRVRVHLDTGDLSLG